MTAPAQHPRFTFKHVHPDPVPFANLSPVDRNIAWADVGQWPARWICDASDDRGPWFALFRLKVDLPEALTLRLHLTGDERFEFAIDGQRICRGPHRGSASLWHYHTVEVSFSAGSHVLIARLYSLETMPRGSMATVRHGFLCAVEKENLRAIFATGFAGWEVQKVRGWVPTNHAPKLNIHSDPGVTIHADEFPWGALTGEGEGWHAAANTPEHVGAKHLNAARHVHWLTPTLLGPMERGRWEKHRIIAEDEREGKWLATALLPEPRGFNEAILVPAGKSRRLLVNLGDYACLWPALEASGEGTVEMIWCEVLFKDLEEWQKLPMDQWIGGSVAGVTDRFVCDGTVRLFEPPWWRAGAWVEIRLVADKDGPLTLQALRLEEIGSDFPDDGGWASDDPDLAKIRPVALRTMRCCSHDAFMDCPVYEQRFYTGDGRFQALFGYVARRDDSSARTMFDMVAASAQNPLHIPAGSYPSSGFMIPTYAFWAIAALHDHALWRGDVALLKKHLPWARRTMDAFLADRDSSGMIVSPVGWNFIDGKWPGMHPPGGYPGGRSTMLNLLFALAAGNLAELEAWSCEPELAARWNRLHLELLRVIEREALDEANALVRDAPGTVSAAEHTQVLAVLAGLRPDLHGRLRHRIKTWEGLDERCSGQFIHLRWEALALGGDADPLLGELRPWRNSVHEGAKTFPEYFGGTRSECHAWNAHPLFHFAATIAGIRPAAFGFTKVRISPRLGSLREVSAFVPHPRGKVTAQFRREGGDILGIVTLPESVTGTLIASDRRETALVGGENKVSFR